jgi:hypothetical protein
MGILHWINAQLNAWSVPRMFSVALTDAIICLMLAHRLIAMP